MEDKDEARIAATQTASGLWRVVATATAAPTLLIMVVALSGFVSGFVAAALIAATVASAYVAARRGTAAVNALTAFLNRLADGDLTASEPKRVGDVTDEAAAAANRLRRRLAEASSERIEQAETQDAIIDALPDPLLLLDGERRIRRANAAARQQFGDALEGRSLSAVLRHPTLLEAADRAATDNESRIVELTTPSPFTRNYSAKVQPGPGGTQDGVLVSLRDVTALKNNEQMRSDFVANASHELRTPLSSLIGFIETLQGPARDDASARDRFLEIMRDQAARMARLVEGLMSLSRIEAGEHSTPQDVVDLGEIAQAVAAGLELRARAQRMTIDFYIDPAGAHAPGDRDEIAQLVQNLIDNAIKYGRSGGTIRIAVRRLPGGDARLGRTAPHGVAMLAVSDDGAGVPTEHVPRLTERFYRVDEARSRELGGVGLGLSIVKHIVNRHRGVLEIESAPGEGSTFRILFPASPPAGAQAQDPALDNVA